MSDASGTPGGDLEGLFAASLAGGEIRSPRASLVLVEWRDPGGGGDPPVYIAPLHVHHQDDEAWYVLEGTLKVRVGVDDVEVGAGGAVLVPVARRTPTGTPTRRRRAACS